jgi:hypothetical protein
MVTVVGPPSLPPIAVAIVDEVLWIIAKSRQSE